MSSDAGTPTYGSSHNTSSAHTPTHTHTHTDTHKKKLSPLEKVDSGAAVLIQCGQEEYTYFLLSPLKKHVVEIVSISA